MQRRLTKDLLWTEIDSIDRLVSARDGAVFVYLPPDCTRREVQLEDARYDFRAVAKERWVRGRPFLCAVFHWVEPGAYTVRLPSTTVEATVQVHPGRLVQVDWRTAPC